MQLDCFRYGRSGDAQIERLRAGVASPNASIGPGRRTVSDRSGIHAPTRRFASWKDASRSAIGVLTNPYQRANPSPGSDPGTGGPAGGGRVSRPLLRDSRDTPVA